MNNTYTYYSGPGMALRDVGLWGLGFGAWDKPARMLFDVGPGAADLDSRTQLCGGIKMR